MSELGVFNDGDFRRIEAIPRRPIATDAEVAHYQRVLTDHLKTPHGTWVLKPKQAECLTEFLKTGTLWGRVGAGGGKTLLGFLIGTVAVEQFQCKRILILVPAALREKTFDDHTDLKANWRLLPLLAHDDPASGPHIRVLSYETFSTAGFAAYLDEYQPDVVIADEAHAFARLKSGRTKRLFRYLRNARKAGRKVYFVPMSGTFERKSYKDSAHIAEGALGDYSPLPQEYNQLEQWTLAVGEGVSDEQRIGFGALLRLCTDDEANQGINGVRRAINRRILEAPGVVASTKLECDLPLILQHRHVVVPPEVKTAMDRLRREYMLPGDIPVEAGVAFWSHAREVAAGFAYKWDPEAPWEWKAARSAWVKFVNEALKSSKIDTPLQVWNAVESGAWGDVPEFHAWRDIRHTFKPRTKPIWISDYLVRDAEAWAKETGGIVWVGHTSAYKVDDAEDDESTVGAMFRDIPFFAGGDERIKTYRGPCAASIRSHGTGKNLTQWDEALIMTMPSSGKTLEQLLARHHREKQQADLVRFWFYAHSLENANALDTALADARFLQDGGGAPQRALHASILGADGKNYRRDAFEDLTDPMWWSE